ncbi:MAG: ADP-ribosylglycohydrolase family protein [Meiothermus sp.]|nr:ADP-ribosylglycohydrolase family protein [Meiothermus sp.]
MKLPPDYAKRAYAGVLGKMIGVFLGRPIEGWSYDQISARFGEVRAYLHEAVGRPLILPDDDLSGTFAFLRALEDNGYPRDLSSRQIGEAWLNYIVEGRSILWWGGMGNSTEQTAYFRLRQGVPAPQSGSMELNTRLIAEQIGAQIFIDGWAMVAPGDPDLAFHLATEAARVSHDGEAVYAAQVLAVMESLAFVEPDLGKLLDAGLSYIPRDSVIHKLITDLREVRQRVEDWREARVWLEHHYGYDKFRGNVHVVPNHGVIVLSLLYGQDDFLQTLMIANTCGWDTDCNSGNVGCLMGIKLGLEGIDAAPHLREPLADRLFVSSAEGSRSVTDAVTLTDEIVRAGHRLAGLEHAPHKGGAQYHFEQPGAVQGFVLEGAGRLSNVEGGSRKGARSLEVRFEAEHPEPVRVFARSFLPPEVPEPPDAPYARNLGSGWNYMLLASPRYYPGQTVTVALSSTASKATRVSLFCRHYDANDQLVVARGPQAELTGGYQELSWQLPDLGGPVADLGLEVEGGSGRLWLDWLGVSGEPSARFTKLAGSGSMWRRAWVNAADRLDKRFPEAFRVLHMRGLGQVSIGSRDWRDYTVRAALTPYLAKQSGVAIRHQGLNRCYAVLLVKPGKLQIVKLQGEATVLAETAMDWAEGQEYAFTVSARGSRITAEVGGVWLEAQDPERPLTSGGIALMIEEGWLSCREVGVGSS